MGESLEVGEYTGFRDMRKALEEAGFSIGSHYADKRSGYTRHKISVWGGPIGVALGIVESFHPDAYIYRGEYIVYEDDPFYMGGLSLNRYGKVSSLLKALGVEKGSGEWDEYLRSFGEES